MRQQYLGRKNALAASTMMVTAAAIAAGAFSVSAHAQDEDAASEPVIEDVIRVSGAFIPDEKRDTSEITSVVEADDFAIAGDSDIASALKRVTGLSVSRDNKFVFARGLNERYSQATLNRSPLPSPEPLRRTVPLDIFPTAVLESTLVQKTFSPAYSGEFGGASIDLRTKAVPDAAFIEFGGSLGVNTATTFEDALLYDGGDTDYLGFDDGTRNTPALIAEVDNITGLSTSDADRAQLLADIADPSLVVIQRGDAGPNGSFSLAAGDRYDLADWLSVGLTAAGGYSNSWSTREGIRDVDDIRFSTQNSIESNALISFGADILDNHVLRGTLLGARSTEKEARIITAGSEDQDVGFRRDDSTEWFERQLWSTQIQGEHVLDALGGLEVNWRGSYSESFRDAPFQFTAVYNRDDVTDPFEFAGAVASSELRFSKVEDDTTDFGVDFLYPLALGAVEFDLSAGYAYTEADRESLAREFTINIDQNTDRRADIAIAAADPDGFDESGRTAFPPAAISTLEVDAGYVNVEGILNENVSFTLGGRYEDYIIAVDSFDPALGRCENFGEPGCGPVEPEGNIQDSIFLPAGTVTLTSGDFQLRLAASQSIIRPQFRELSPTIFRNTETDQRFFGNPFLKTTEADNLDARLEYYFGRNEFVTLGVFYKELSDPIEEVQEVFGSGPTTTFVNAPSATLQGVEFEFEKRFELEPVLGSFFSNRELLLKGNYTVSTSEIEVSDGDVVVLAPTSAGLLISPVTEDASSRLTDGRALQGQSDNIVNAIVGLEDLSQGWRANLVYNFTSERIREAGVPSRAQLSADVIEQLPATLDFNFSKEFAVANSDMEFTFRALNLLDEDYEAFRDQTRTDGTVVRLITDQYEIGQTFTFGLKLRR